MKAGMAGEEAGEYGRSVALYRKGGCFKRRRSGKPRSIGGSYIC